MARSQRLWSLWLWCRVHPPAIIIYLVPLQTTHPPLLSLISRTFITPLPSLHCHHRHNSGTQLFHAPKVTMLKTSTTAASLWSLLRVASLYSTFIIYGGSRPSSGGRQGVRVGPSVTVTSLWCLCTPREERGSWGGGGRVFALHSSSTCPLHSLIVSLCVASLPPIHDFFGCSTWTISNSRKIVRVASGVPLRRGALFPARPPIVLSTPPAASSGKK